MILTIDVGNSNIVFGVFSGKSLIQHWSMGTNKGSTADEYGMFLLRMLEYSQVSPDSIKAVAIASVVPPIMYSLEHSIRKYLRIEPLVVGPGVKTGINVKYENPRDVGADRIANAVAACELYGCPVIIVDFGTATIFCAVGTNSTYLGGIIGPGIKVSSEALFQSAAKLPRVDFAKPEMLIGRNVVTSMQSGIYYGFVGMTDYIVRKMKKEMREENIKVVATGNFAGMIAGESGTIDVVNSFLTLEGLRIIYERNKDGSV
jgi:type III pantothenate kinase